MMADQRYEPMFIDEQVIRSVYDLDYCHRANGVNDDILKRYVIGSTAMRWNDWTEKPGYRSVFPPFVRVEEWADVAVPFSGFYESVHDALIDQTLERMMGDSDGDSIKEALEFANGDMDWGKVHLEYARAYASELLGDERHTFVRLHSPREYNFTTDRIFIKMPLNSLWKMYRLKEVQARLKEVAADLFTSRSGFHSFYDPDVTTWGSHLKWDANQWLAVLQSYLDVTIPVTTGTFDSECEEHLMERWVSNGNLDNLLWSSLSNPSKVEELLGEG